MAEENRLQRLSGMGDQLEKMSCVINWEMFRPLLEEALHNEPKAPGGRPHIDRIVMFKVVLLQKWYNLGDDNTEFQINDRLSFQRFLGLSLSDKVPDAKTIWAFKERLKENDLDLQLFTLFEQKMEAEGIITREGSIIDASFVDVPRQRNTREENKIIKEGSIPPEWLNKENENMYEQKDTDARWAKKNEELHYGYKDHAKVDVDSKMIVGFTVTPANVYDGLVFHELFDNMDKLVYADCAYGYRKTIEEILKDFPHVKLFINEKGVKNRPLTDEQKANNREMSRTRVRVEHAFGHMTNSMGGMTIRCIGIDRAVRDIAMKNLAYNMHRLGVLQGSKTDTAA